MATVIIPTPLRKFTNNTARLEVKAGTIQDTVNELTRNFPDLKKHLLDEGGGIRSSMTSGPGRIRPLSHLSFAPLHSAG